MAVDPADATFGTLTFNFTRMLMVEGGCFDPTMMM